MVPGNILVQLDDYVSDDVDCEAFSITYTNETGETGYNEDEPFFNKEECNADGTAGADDDPSGYYSIGEFRGKAGEYTVDGTHESTPLALEMLFLKKAERLLVDSLLH